MSAFWRGKAVLVAGGSGFVGSHVVESLLRAGATPRVAGRRRERLVAALGSLAADVEFVQGDLATPAVARRACAGVEAVFNLAAQVAGVGYNRTHPGELFTSNVACGLAILDAAVREAVDRFLCMSSACVYRRHCTVPTPETEGFAGEPEETNFGYGWAKRALEVQARCCAREFPIKIAIVRPYNVYGPRDNFDWETSHVIPALVRKAVEGHDPISVWGDGTQTRSFLYVEDLARGLLLALERYAVCDPVNLGSLEEVTVEELVRLVVELAGTTAALVFDASGPSGQPRRRGDLSKAREQLGFEARIPLREGLKHTIEWYLANARLRSGPSCC